LLKDVTETQPMNAFEKKLAEIDRSGLFCRSIDTIQVNVGLQCNQECLHCHLEAGPHRKEIMGWPEMEMILAAADQVKCRTVDITGGAPEMNPHFRPFLEALHSRNLEIMVRTNLTVLLERGMEDLPGLFRQYGIHLIASLPCYLEKNVCAQRGEGSYNRSVEAIRRLNDLGYGSEGDLLLDLVYNPGGPFLPPDQSSLEEDYRRELNSRFGISFSSLLTLTNMPLGRFSQHLRRLNKESEYLQLLKSSFNPGTVEALMCRHQLSVGWDGTLYDCDFNLALGLPVNHGAPDHLRLFDPSALAGRRIVTGDHCFGCTAGHGSSCGGALA
jgi:radical SAM/Cys-rich protein